MLKKAVFICFIAFLSTAIGDEALVDICRRPVLRNSTGTCNEKQTMHNEGECLCCYTNDQGNPTIGIGFDLNREDAESLLSGFGLNFLAVLEDCWFNTTKSCLTNTQSLQLFHTVSYYEAKSCVDYYVGELPSPKYEAVVDVAFTVGCQKFIGYKKFIEALRQQKWEKVAEELLDTKWAGLVTVERRDSDYSCIKRDEVPTTTTATTKKPSNTTTTPSNKTAATTITNPPTTTTTPSNKKTITCENLVAYYIGKFAPDPASKKPPTGVFNAQIELRLKADQSDRKVHVSYPNYNASYSAPDGIFVDVYNEGWHSCKDPSGQAESCSSPFNEIPRVFEVELKDTTRDGIYDIAYFGDFDGQFTLTNAIGQCTRDNLRDPSEKSTWPDTTKFSYCICCGSYSPDESMGCPVNPYA